MRSGLTGKHRGDDPPHHENGEPIILDRRDEPVVAYPIPPKGRQLSREGGTHSPGVFARGYPFSEKLQNSPLFGCRELAQLSCCRSIELDVPFHSASSSA